MATRGSKHPASRNAARSEPRPTRTHRKTGKAPTKNRCPRVTPARNFGPAAGLRISMSPVRSLTLTCLSSLVLACGPLPTLAEAGPPDAGSPDAGPEETFTVRFVDGSSTDSARNRVVAWRLYYPVEALGPRPVLLFSHGGNGTTGGAQRNGHLGTEWARYGFLALHLNHLPSANQDAHERDRPRDVSFILDQLAAGALPLPAGLLATPDLSRVGHCGHSWGAYTAHAVGGGTFTQGRFRDPRIRAIVPISPQGPDQFGSFDRGPSDNTWRTVEVPAYTLLGSLEKDGPLTEPSRQPDWRLFPFERYPPGVDRFATVIPGADHDDMMDKPGVTDFVAQNSRRFFQVYVEGRTEGVCALGTLAALPGLDHRVKPGGGPAAGCP